MHKNYIESLENPRNLTTVLEFLELELTRTRNREQVYNSSRKQDYLQQISLSLSVSNNNKLYPTFNQQFITKKNNNRIVKEFHVAKSKTMAFSIGNSFCN